jgi:hypothetical protein
MFHINLADSVRQHLAALEHRMTKLIKKKASIADIQGLRQYHVLWMRTAARKEEFLNNTFLNQPHQFDFYQIKRSFLSKKNDTL